MTQQESEPLRRSSPKSYALMGYLLILTAFGGLGLWAATAEIDSAVMASGQVALEGDRKVVQHLRGGIVERVHVREADSVKAGDVLLVLDNVEIESQLSILAQRQKVARAAEARLLAEQTGAETMDLPDDLVQSDDPKVLQALKVQKAIFSDRRSIYDSRADILAFRTEQLEEQIRGLELKKVALETRIGLRDEMIKRLKSGENKGVVERNRLVEREDAFVQLKADRGDVISEISRLRGATGEERLNLLKLEQEFRERATLELKEIQTELAELEENIRVTSQELERTEIRAPTSGSVQNLGVSTEGSVIRAGEVLMEIVPTDAPLVVDAHVAPTDIDNVFVQQETEVRFSAFQTKLMPITLGHVQSVSNDVIDPQDGRTEPYYLARIQVPDDNMPEDIRSALVAGMPADVVIITGERSVLSYLVSPLTDVVRKSMREN